MNPLIGSKTINCPPPPTINLNAAPNPVNQGNTSVVSWTTAFAASCIATNGDASWPGVKTTANPPAAPATYSTKPLFADTVYTLTCVNSLGDATVRSATVNVTAIPPTATITKLDQPDYCASGPAVTGTWQYNSAPGLPKSKWQAQIASDALFASIVYDSGEQAFLQDESQTARGWFSRTITALRSFLGLRAQAAPLTATYSFTGGNGSLSFNKTYWVRVKAWDSMNASSTWSAAMSFNTPAGAYPAVDFTIDPAKPVAKQPTTFTDTSNYNGAIPLQRVWDFGDGTVVTENPGTGTISHTYADQSNGVNVKLTIISTSSTPNSCSNTQTMSVTKPIPIYKEVRPGTNSSPTPTQR